ncbi:MAG: polysaccharide deacetylase family protein [Wenzhouxiangella sp.]|nr:MAG: polysaccharide deacetylase family protein [Wenzhouxiangella sp.]
MSAAAIPVLTYHGYNVAGNDYADNDHVALARDLAWLGAHGWTVVPLGRAVRSLFDGADAALPEKAICLTFDDGTDLDWIDVEFGELGHQRGLYGILEDFQRRDPQRAAPHATAFVIACPHARARMATAALQHGHGMAEQWWALAERSELMSIGNHSWDHRHPLVVSAEAGGGNFFSVDDLAQAKRQVVESGHYIAARTGAWPELFAYPWGQASDFLRFEFFPTRVSEHGVRAAFGTEPGPMHAGSDRWYLPRYVCGEHWRDPAGLAAVLK